MTRRLLCVALLLACGLPAYAQTQTSPVQVPDWALAPSPTHKQVPPPADFHRPTRTEKQVTGIFEGVSEVGGPLVPGSSTYDAATGVYRVTSSGYNIWYQRDEFRFLWKRMSGDVSLAADVKFENPEPHTDRKVVLAIRQTLEDDSKQAVVAEHGTGMVHLAERPEKGAQTQDQEYTFGGTLKGVMAQRLGIEKHGDEIYLLVSIQGEPMHRMGPPITLHLEGSFYVGIGFCPHIPDTLDTGVFSKVTLENRATEVRSSRSH
jgi:hypothetical protein